MIDRCVCCGAVIPEGRMICPSCEREFADGRTKQIGSADLGKICVVTPNGKTMCVESIKPPIETRGGKCKANILIRFSS